MKANGAGTTTKVAGTAAKKNRHLNQSCRHRDLLSRPYTSNRAGITTKVDQGGRNGSLRGVHYGSSRSLTTEETGTRIMILRSKE